MSEQPTTYTIFTDGGARGNPGPAAIGVFIRTSKSHETRLSRYIGIQTNNIAEYEAVYEALVWVTQQSHTGKVSVHIYVDSQLICRQLKGEYKIKDTTLKELYTSIKILESNYPITVVYHEIPRALNGIADALVNRALDKQSNI